MNIIPAILFASLTLLLSACGLWGSGATNSSVVCEEVDWYEIGRQDGSRGLPHSIKQKEAFKSCASGNLAHHEGLYYNGHQAGLVEFCTRDNGYAIGQAGQTYYATCPAGIEAGFLSGYIKGQKVFRLKKQSLLLDRDIQALSSRLNSPQLRSNTRTGLQKQLSQLRETKVEINQTLNEIERSL